MSIFPNAHDSKFDRQLRLWGSHGQASLESAHICLLGSTATASETLKNLVLPNIGKFTIIDDELATESDLGQNFFVSTDWIGKSRAEAVKSLILELNSAVVGDHLHESPLNLIKNQIEYFTQFDLIISTQINSLEILSLADFLYEKSIPLILLRSFGLLGLARLQIREHLIIESHPANDRFDLFVHPQQLVHWPELRSHLQQYRVAVPTKSAGSSESSSLSSADEKTTDFDPADHSHIPYIAILSQLMDSYLRSHNQRIPSTFDEKKQFKQFIIDAAWNFGEEENFQEALEFAHRAYEMPKLDAATLAVIEDPAANEELNSQSNKFWILAAAAKKFFQNEGNNVCWPASMELPDMHSKTQYYVELKQLFIQKAERDINSVWRHAKSILAALGRSSDEISYSDVEYFVKNLRGIRIVRTRSLREEFHPSTFNTESINELLSDAAECDEPLPADADGDDSEMEEKPFQPLTPPVLYWYFALRAADEFARDQNNYPGSDELTWESDGDKFYSYLNKFVSDHKLLISERNEFDESLKKIAIEISRFAACEPHTTAAFMGGMGAQIALKVILKQYVPINNTFIYNGIHCSALTANL